MANESRNTGLIVKSRLTENYTVTPNHIWRDDNLSLKAKGLLGVLLSLPSDWSIYKTQLCNFSKDGRDATIAAFNELVENGYVMSVKRIDANTKRFLGHDYIVYDTKIPSGDTKNPIPENPKTEIPKTENPSLLSKDKQSKEILSKELESNILETSILGKIESMRQPYKSVYSKIVDKVNMIGLEQLSDEELSLLEKLK